MSASTDFYKKIALECSSQQIAMDLFVCTSQYVDLVTICKRSICISIMYDTVTAIFLGKTVQKVTTCLYRKI